MGLRPVRNPHDPVVFTGRVLCTLCGARARCARRRQGQRDDGVLGDVFLLAAARGGLPVGHTLREDADLHARLRRGRRDLLGGDQIVAIGFRPTQALT